MLDLDAADLASLADALGDRSAQWWFDPMTGQLEPWSELYGDELDEGHPEERGLLLVEPIDSSEAYRDMEDFIASVPDPRARDLLERAIAGRGAFRRFKDTLYDFPDLRDAWFALSDARMERRALRWLADEGVVDREIARRAADHRTDPTPPPGAPDA